MVDLHLKLHPSEALELLHPQARRERSPPIPSAAASLR
jgi:hypothetical protein